MNTVVVEATYHNGVLKLDRPLPLNDNERVRITVESATGWAERTYGIVKWTGDADALEQLATDPELAFPPPADES